MDRQYHKTNITYNINQVEDKIGLDKEHLIYDKIDVFVDRFNKDKCWAVLTYKTTENKKEIENQVVVVFENQKDYIDFINKTFSKKIQIHNIDTSMVYLVLHYEKYEKEYMDIVYKEYINGELSGQKIFRAPRKYHEMLEKALEEYRKSDSRISRAFDGYSRETPTELRARIEEEHPRRILRQERRMEKERRTFPMPEQPKKKISIGKIAAYTLLAATLCGTGYVIVRNAFKDKPVVFEQKKESVINRRDRYIAINKDHASEVVDKVMDKKLSELKEEDLPFFYKFVDEVIAGNFDNNSSSIKVLYQDYFDDKYLERDDGTRYTLNFSEVNDLLERIESKYDDCFGYDSKGNLALKEKNAMNYLNFVGSLSIMKNRYPGSRNNDIPKYDDSDEYYASTKDVSIFSQFDPILEYLILSQYRGVLKHVQFNPSLTAYYFDEIIDKDTLLRRVDERIEFLKQIMNSNYNASKRNSM